MRSVIRTRGRNRRAAAEGRAGGTIRAGILPNIHHDALDFPDGHVILLTPLAQCATTLHLPGRSRNAEEKQAQQRVPCTGVKQEGAVMSRSPWYRIGLDTWSLSLEASSVMAVAALAWDKLSDRPDIQAKITALLNLNP